ncbi:hypothetical protein ABK046_30535 [Streptomyces caeruleatus]
MRNMVGGRGLCAVGCAAEGWWGGCGAGEGSVAQFPAPLDACGGLCGFGGGSVAQFLAPLDACGACAGSVGVVAQFLAPLGACGGLCAVGCAAGGRWGGCGFGGGWSRSSPRPLGGAAVRPAQPLTDPRGSPRASGARGTARQAPTGPHSPHHPGLAPPWAPRRSQDPLP